MCRRRTAPRRLWVEAESLAVPSRSDSVPLTSLQRCRAVRSRERRFRTHRRSDRGRPARRSLRVASPSSAPNPDRRWRGPIRAPRARAEARRPTPSARRWTVATDQSARRRIRFGRRAIHRQGTGRSLPDGRRRSCSMSSLVLWRRRCVLRDRATPENPVARTPTTVSSRRMRGRCRHRPLVLSPPMCTTPASIRQKFRTSRPGRPPR